MNNPWLLLPTVALLSFISANCAGTSKETPQKQQMRSKEYLEGIKDAKAALATGKLILPIGPYLYSRKRMVELLERRGIHPIAGDSGDYFSGYREIMRKAADEKFEESWWTYDMINSGELFMPPTS